MAVPETVFRRLRQAGLRISAARLGVMQVLQAAGAVPLETDEVYQQMVQLGAKASLSTVYRVMSELEERGLLLREWGRHRKAGYRIKPTGFDAHRLRLVCQDCGHSVAFSDRALLTALERVVRARGLSLAGQAVAIPCECRGCDAAQQAQAVRPCAPSTRTAWPAAANGG